ncbi:unnamed protein product [Candidula unifasciata]|uniref:Guanine nucleotide-binding protein-like 1 n=1 Tax=Candidula unifasciata TaxID=100452 RepID=A0A8S4A4B2_9EUPU|nr:unnamed protein product [Candidula unifasciata]
MHRKKPFSGKQKKQQLKDKKVRKQDGPSYLADDSDEDEKKKLKTHHPGKTAGSGFGHDLEVLKVHEQPRKGDPGKMDANSFRLHFFKESDEEVAKRKKEAMKPLTTVDKKYLEYKVEDVFPPDAKLDFPKRPPWNYRLSREELEQQERDYFKAYVSDILDQPRARDLSYFELNLETWRQLWRVLEISDILLVIADIRFPVVHIPPSLITYLLKDLHRNVIIILNKVDFVPTVLALAWKQYLQTAFPGIHVVFFSSYPRASHPDDNPVNFDPTAALYKRPYRGKRALPVGPSQLFQVVKEIVQNKVELSSWEKKIALDSSSTQAEEISQSESAAGFSQSDDFNTSRSQEESDGTDYVKYKDGIVTIGCLGYPNVGKSSVMNALVGKKVVSVSKTPGHTKHLQTIFLCPTVRLCDCPAWSSLPWSQGLYRLIIAGIFPVAQVKEPYSVVGYLAQRLNLPKLLKVTPPDCETPDELKDYKWTAFDICQAWAIKCGFTTSRAGRPDTYRAANQILRLAAEGQLCLCFRPPDYAAQLEKLMSDPEANQLINLFSSRSHGNSSNNQDRDDQMGSDDESDDEDDDADRSGEEDEDIEESEVNRNTAKAGIFARLQELSVDEESP